MRETYIIQKEKPAFDCFYSRQLQDAIHNQQQYKAPFLVLQQMWLAKTLRKTQEFGGYQTALESFQLCSFAVVVAISLRLTLGQECTNFCWRKVRKAGGRRDTRACLPRLTQTLCEKGPLQKYRKIDGKWEQGGRKQYSLSWRESLTKKIQVTSTSQSSCNLGPAHHCSSQNLPPCTENLALCEPKLNWIAPLPLLKPLPQELEV